MRASKITLNIVAAVIIAILFIFCLFTGSANALMLEMSIDELTDDADFIVKGYVEEITSRWNADQTGIYTTVLFAVDDNYKNEAIEGTIMVIVPGGTVGDLTQAISDMPVFEVGEETVLFLNQRQRRQLWDKYPEPVSFEVHGLFQGKANIREGSPENISIEDLEEQLSYNLEENNTAGKLTDDESGPNLVGSFNYQGRHWPGPSPVVTYRINASSAYTSQIVAAAETWNNAGADFEFEYSGQHSRSGTESRNGINEILFYSSGTGNVLATAIVWFRSNGEIVETDMVFNSSHYWSTTTFSYPYHDIQTVALHEFGHWLSLEHSPNMSSVMYYRILGTRRSLHAEDIAGIRHIYSTPFSAPLNDNFTDRITISGASGSATGSNVGATMESGEPAHAAVPSAGNSVWWQWTAPSDGKASFDTFGSNFDTVLAVYTGSGLQTLSTIASNDDAGNGLQSRVEFDVAAGTNYKIAAAGYNSASGAIALNWALTPHPCSVTNPGRPTGPEEGYTGATYTFTGSPVACSNNHSTEYRFDWGDGSFSNWSASASAEKLWDNPGSYDIFIQARCAENRDAATSISAPKTILITHEVIYHQLIIEIEGNGNTSPAAGTYHYQAGEEVNLEATPADGWTFSHWLSENTELLDSALAILIETDITYTAVFSPVDAEESLPPDPEKEETETEIDPDEEADPGTNGGEEEEEDNTETDDSETESGSEEEDGDDQSAADTETDNDAGGGNNDGGTIQPAPIAPAAPAPTLYAFTITTDGKGTTNPQPGEHSYAENYEIKIFAKPASGWLFDRWVIDGKTYNSSSVNIKFEDHTKACAYFKVAQRGDITGDGSVTVNDITLAMRHSLGLAELGDTEKLKADVNGDGVVNILDIALLMRYALGLIDSLP